MIFDKAYNLENRRDFLNYLRVKLFQDNLKESIKPIKIDKKTIFFDESSCFELGKITLDKEISIFEIKQKSKNDPRITLTRDAFKIMESKWVQNALFVFYSHDSSSWRLSLLTLKKSWWETETSNPKRYSFLLGEWEKTRTPEKYLSKIVTDFKDLVSRFDVEVVRKEFFNDYLTLYIRLYKAITDDSDFTKLLTSQKVEIVSFAKNLLWKIVFLYFIQKKGWLWVERDGKYWEDGDKNFMRNMWNDFTSWEKTILEKHGYFYNDYLEWLFFAWLNKDNSDNDDFNEYFNQKVPYLNGWLFKEDYKWWRDNVSKISNDIFSNENKDGILDTFDLYNFTIDEDDLYDSDIAIDPEMLGRIFEKMISISPENIDEIVKIYESKKKIEIDKELNKKFGAFYTPREIVYYMTKESIISYLLNNLKGKKEENENKIRILFDLKEKFLVHKEDITEEVFETLANIIEEVDEKLQKVKILDPAIGSGAFPMWILHEISTIRYYIYWAFYIKFKVDDKIKDFLIDNPVFKATWKWPEKVVSMYKIKRDIIQNNIYWVDISAGAIDIARLRFWLSLVVDEETPEPLPNFEFKFVCANTLIPLAEEKEQSSLELWWVKELNAETLRKYMVSFYNAKWNKDKEEAKARIEKFLWIWKNLVMDMYNTKSERTKQLETYEPFNSNHSAEFFDPSLMMGNGKFDIVIGNPPYIQLQKDWGFLWKMYENKWYETFTKTWDIYGLFYEYSIKVLKQWWISTMITSNKWMRAWYWEKLRSYFVDNTNPLVLIDLWSWIFETATVDSNILILEKKEVKSFNLKALNLSKEDKLRDIYSFLNKSVLIKELSKENWNILSNIEFDIKNKIEKAWTPLWKWNVKILRWILTWLDEAFIIDEETKNNLISLDIKNSDIIKETIRWKIIYKYAIEKSWRYLINSHNWLVSQGLWNVNIGDYPYLKQYLDKFEPKLSKRYDKWDTPYNLRNCAYLNEFTKEKIIFSRIVKSPQFYYDDQWYFAEATSYILTWESIKYLLALLNSSIVYKLFYMFYAWGWIDWEIKIAKFVNLPIPKLSEEKQKPFIEKVDKILEITKQPFYDPKNPPKEQLELEREIDEMVYELYGLSDEEVRVVEESLK